MEGKVLLGYWHMRGLSERCRQLLEYCKVPYQQKRYVCEDRDYWFNQVKPQMIKKHPAITLPYLQDGDELVTESDAVQVYICLKGNRTDLLGRNNKEVVTIATVRGVFKDLEQQYENLCYQAHGFNSFEEAKPEFKNRFRDLLNKLKGIKGDKPYVAGQITYIDFRICDFMQHLALFMPDLTAEFPELVEYQKRLWALPELQDYFASDRFQERPVNDVASDWR